MLYRMKRSPYTVRSMFCYITILCVIMGMIISIVPGTSVNAADQQTITYQASNENFPNPERGFMPAFVVGWPFDANGRNLATWDFCGQGNNFTAYKDNRLNAPLRAEEMVAMRASGQSTARVYYHFAKYRNAPLGEDALNLLRSDFQTARDGGVKLAVQFTYNFAKGGPDAPLERVLQHIEQVKPILHENQDVLLAVNLGWIGCWGEMHTSSNGLVSAGANYNDKTKQIIDAMLAATPSERFLLIRYPVNKFIHIAEQTTPIDPVSSTDAFGNSAYARIGHQDECIDCGEFNGGTLWADRDWAQAAMRYLEADTQYVPQLGESDGLLDPDEPAEDLDGDGFTRPEHDSCERMIGTDNNPGLLARQHFSGIDSDTPKGLEGAPNLGIAAGNGIKRWKQDGCYDEIAQRLGYRFVLQSAILPTTATPGTDLPISFTMQNTGFARPYNPRDLELVLRQQDSGTITRLSLGDQDTRLLLPASGSSTTLDLMATLPADLPAGTYDLLLNLPDPQPSLNTRPEYSIRLANQGTWEAATGYNDLQAQVTVGGGTAQTHGLRYDLFANTRLAGTPLVTGVDATVDWQWGTAAPSTGLPHDTFSVRWSGQVAAAQEGTYTFITSSDDGVRLWVNGQRLIDNWTNHAVTENRGSITLAAGQRYDLQLEYYEQSGQATIQLFWEPPGQTRQIIPSERLYPSQR
ncbi:MAG: hypothetical protein GFH26_640177n132 [Chloroflexi bacterium AL-N15]|nr:hypothetical protein [Chloroflexi bacterium AL-N15]